MLLRQDVDSSDISQINPVQESSWQLFFACACFLVSNDTAAGCPHGHIHDACRSCADASMGLLQVLWQHSKRRRAVLRTNLMRTPLLASWRCEATWRACILLKRRDHCTG